MKTAIKIAALSAALILAVLSCTDIAVTTPDWKAIEEKSNTGNLYGAKTPSAIVTENKGYLPQFGNVPSADTDRARELQITFVEGADICKADNSSIISELKKFMTFYRYTPASKTWEPSTIVAEVDDYIFVRRENKDTETIITVRLAKKEEYLLVKIDGTKYTFGNGLKLDLNGDGKAGEAIYDDAYKVIGTNSGNTFVPAGGGLTSYSGNNWGTYQNWVLNVVDDSIIGSTFQNNSTTIEEEPNPNDYPLILKVASINLNPTSGVKKLGNSGTGEGNNNEEIKKAEVEILNMVKGKFKLQKYKGNGTWENMPNEVLMVERDGFEPAGNGNGAGTAAYTTDSYLYIALIPENKEIYRIRAEGITDLITGEYVGAKQIVQLNMDSLPAFPRGKGNTFTSDYQVFQTEYDVTYLTGDATLFSSSANKFINYDRDGKNVTIEMEVPVLKVKIGKETTDTELSLQSMSLADFNKGFKLAYTTNATPASRAKAAINNLAETNIAFMDIVGIEVNESTYTESGEIGEGEDPIIYLTLKLDPQYQYKSGDAFAVLLSPRFNGFGEPKVIFGNPANIGIIIKVGSENIDCWDVYGTITL